MADESRIRMAPKTTNARLSPVEERLLQKLDEPVAVDAMDAETRRAARRLVQLGYAREIDRGTRIRITSTGIDLRRKGAA